MPEAIAISYDEIIQQIKLSCLIPSAIEGIATRKIITRVAEEQGIEVKPSELQQAADNFRLLNKLQNAQDTWLWLQKHSLSLDEFEELVYTTVISSKLSQHLFAEKVEPFFVEHQLDYAQAVLYEVILDDEDLALELFYALQEREISFHDVARQYIQEPNLRRAGGYRGMLHSTDLKPEISAAVFAAIPPQIIKPIVTSQGVHLILVEELIQPQLNPDLKYKIMSDLFSTWLKQRIEEVDVVIQLYSDSSNLENSSGKESSIDPSATPSNHHSKGD